MPWGLFLGIWYTGGIDFPCFPFAKLSNFGHNFRPTRNNEDV